MGAALQSIWPPPPTVVFRQSEIFRRKVKFVLKRTCTAYISIYIYNITAPSSLSRPRDQPLLCTCLVTGRAWWLHWLSNQNPPMEYPQPLLQPEWSYLEPKDLGLLSFRAHDSRLSSWDPPQDLCAEGSCTDVLVRVDLNVVGLMQALTF